MIVGVAGHIDHGKTALVRALTGVEGDRLKEEKARGVTIDLGFAYLSLGSGRTIGFIDAPGHERLVHTMLAGASGIDFALLTVAADDGVKPQTLEHLAIIDLLGVRRGLVALTKADLASPERLAAATSGIRAAIAGTTLEGAPIVPVSALTGEGVDDLRAMLAAAADEATERSAEARFRLAVDRAFTLAGVGVVVTGTALSGTVHVGDHVVISPSGLPARVRSLHAQNAPTEAARAGDRCALNLSGPAISKEAIHRGDVVLDPELHAPTARIDAVLRLLPSELKPIGQWFPARLHHAAAESGAHIVLLGDEPLAPGGSAQVQLALDRPIAAAAQDRFVIRDASAQRTIGGGRFIDLRPEARRRRTPERRAQREALALADADASFAALLDAPPYAHDLARFARDRAMSAAQTERLSDELGVVLLRERASKIAISRARWKNFVSGLKRRLAEFHAENPDLQGVGREKLRMMLEPRLPGPVFLAALQTLAQGGDIALAGAFVRLASHVARLSAKDEAAWKAIAPMLDGAERFRPPRVRDISASTGLPEAETRRILKVASRMGFVDEVAHDHFFLRPTIYEMAMIISDLSSRATSHEFTAAEFRDCLANGRKVAIQILEFFDRHGVTLRRGDLRRVDARRLDLFAASVV